VVSLALPNRPAFELLRKQAKHALKIGRIRTPTWNLADAQLAVAHGFGFATWAALKEQVRQRGRDRSNQSLRTPSQTPIVARDMHQDCPLVGVWTAREPIAGGVFRYVTLEVIAAGSTLTLTQVACDCQGRETAARMTLEPDGQERVAWFLAGHTVLARWESARRLVTIVKREDVAVGEGFYEISPDGDTLSCSAGTQSVTFDRMRGARENVAEDRHEHR
jgi:hypothetical protein